MTAQLRRAFRAGMSAQRAAEIAGCNVKYARRVGVAEGWLERRGSGPRPRNDTLRQAIIDGYAANRSPAAIAAEQGSTSASVRVLAGVLGVSRTPQAAGALRRKQIPPELVADYANLRRKRFSAAEAEAMLGIGKGPGE